MKYTTEMKNILVTLVFLVFVTSIPAQILSNRPDNFEVTAENYIDFIPIAPIQVNGDLTVNGNILWNGKSPIVRGDQVSLRFGNNNYVKAGWGNVVQDGNKHPIEIQKY